MAQLLDQKSSIKLLRREGWRKTVGGKHDVKMAKDGHRPITLPAHGGERYSKRLTNDIIRQAGLAKETAWKSPSKSIEKARATGHTSSSSRDASPPASR